MQRIAPTDIFESIKEKISNPVMFTYFWIFCTFNLKQLLILFNEPKLFSIKLAFLYEWQTFFYPALLTLLALLLLPWINNFAEIWKLKANNWMQQTLHNLSWHPMVEEKVHSTALREIEKLQNNIKENKATHDNSQQKLINELSNVNKEKADLDAEFKNTVKNINELTTTNETLKIEIKSAEEKLDRLNNTSQSSNTTTKKGTKPKEENKINDVEKTSIFESIHVNNRQINELPINTVSKETIVVPYESENQAKLDISRPLKDNEKITVFFDGQGSIDLAEPEFSTSFFFEGKKEKNLRFMLNKKSKNPKTPNAWIEEEFLQYRIKGVN